MNKRCGLFECGSKGTAKKLRHQKNNYDIKSWSQMFLKQINSSRRCWSSDEGAVVRLLRIGKYKAVGETVKVTLQINCEQQSPSFNHKNRTAQRKLFNDIRNDFMKFISTSESTMWRVVGCRVIFRIVRAAYKPQSWSQYAYAKGTRHNGWNQTFMVVNKRGTAMKDEVRKLCV